MGQTEYICISEADNVIRQCKTEEKITTVDCVLNMFIVELSTESGD